MARHTFLDSILNRPSQNYAPSSTGNPNSRGPKWQAPSDLPNAPGSSTQHSMLGGSLFKKKSKANLSQYGGSEAGASTSTLGFKSRFGRKKRDSTVGDLSGYSNATFPGNYATSNAGSVLSHNYQPAGSVAGSQATLTTKQKRWWEGGSIGFGRRSRAGSIAGESIFSEPELPAGQVPWNSHGLAGIGSSAKPKRAAQSDYGTSRSYAQMPHPPMPPNAADKANLHRSTSVANIDVRSSRLQSDVAPLGATNLNPSLQQKSSKSKLKSSSNQNLRKEASTTSIQARISSPPQSPTVHSRTPGALANSPHVRRLSQDDNRSKISSTGAGADWKDFVKSMSGSEVSKVWEGSQSLSPAPDMSIAAAKGRQSVNLERRKSHFERVQKELEEEAQFEQNLRDPGVKHQDLIARAASQVVGSPPADEQGEGVDYVTTSFKPGMVVNPAPASQHPIETPSSPSFFPKQEDQLMPKEHVEGKRYEDGAATNQSTIERSSSNESLEEESSEEEDSDDQSIIPKQTMLEAVREEDEDGSSTGGESLSRRTTLTSVRGNQDTNFVSPTAEAPRYRAFESALNKSRFSTSSIPNVSYSERGSSVRTTSNKTESLAESRQSEDRTEEVRHSDLPSLQITKVESLPSSPTVKDSMPLTNQLHIVTSNHGSNSGSDEAFEDAMSPASSEAAEPEKHTHLSLNQDKPTPPTPTASIKEAGDDQDPEEIQSEDGDRRSDTSAQTGRATVTFDQKTKINDGDDAKSMRSSRPPTLQRRLSDLSLGTSFGFSNIMRIGGTQSRSSSSRRVKLSDDDEDSTGSKSDEEGDEELKAKIKAEQERLRNMKVGEDFFGGSLNGILDKFDNTDWDEGLSSTVGQLGLDIGTQKSKGESITAQEILSQNAQERMNEIRRLRAEGSTSPEKKKLDMSDARTIESGIAPSFAAVWLLNQENGDAKIKADKESEMIDLPSPATVKQEIEEPVENSKISSAVPEESNLTASPSRLRSFFSGNSLSNMANTSIPNSQSEKRISVLDRPRQRGPKPREMGGVSIAQGKLLPDAKEPEPEDLRSVLDNIWVPPGVSNAKAKQKSTSSSKSEKSAPSELSISPPSSPKSNKTVTKIVSSKDKPAPVKSAIKGSNADEGPKSLADTLFSFKSDKTKPKNSKSASQNKKSFRESKKSSESNAASVQEESVIIPRRSSSASETERQRLSISSLIPSNAEVSEQKVVEDKDASLQSPKPLRPQLSVLPKTDFQEDEAVENNGQGDEVQSPLSDDVSPGINSSRSPPPGSELWSGESAASTGPATPGASDFLDNIGMLPHRSNFSPTASIGEPAIAPSPLEKKLPLPPVPSFDEEYVSNVHSENDDRTPAAIPQNEPIYLDQNKTPRNEKQQPSFGMNLIPPTPPAVEVHNSLKGSMVRTPPTLNEDVEDPMDNANEQKSSSLQRSSSSRSKGSLGRKQSNKKASSTTSASYSEFQGQGLSLPPGLIATTVATSAQRRHSQASEIAQEDLSDPTAKRRKSKSKKSTGKSKDIEQETNLPSPINVHMNQPSSHNSINSPATQIQMQRSLSEGLASLSIPTKANHSDSASSSRGSVNSNGGSRSHSPSPAVSVSERSSAVSSSAKSSSAASDVSSSHGTHKHTAHVPRRIRTVSPSANGGHARTSLMSAISEWESSPIDRVGTLSTLPSAPVSGYSSPVYNHPVGASTSGYSSPVYQQDQSFATRSQSSIYSGPSPSMIRNAPIGAATDAILKPSMPGANRRLSVPMSESLNGSGMWVDGLTGDGSDLSLGVRSEHSVTSLPNVPQSSYRARDPVKASNAIDDRLYAKTTMNTISITSGAFRHSKSLRKKRSSIDVGSTTDLSSRRGSFDSTANNEGALVEELQKTTMALTSHTPPPRKLSSTQLLVQVIACSVDEMDRLLLREKIRSENAFGFVPGRSFCGRVMETGWEVKRMRIGDIVFGLQNSRKCGALAEFMTIEENLTAKAPEDCLTMEQIAALPSVGVMAHQLMVNHCSQLKRGSRVLILNAHDGVGLLTMQECATLGLIIVAHCPNQITDGVAICEANGAHEVIIGEPLWALNTLHESSFDLVVDTVGGRRIYDAARRIIAFEGQFCTCFGDMQSIVGNPNLKSHLRSLRRTFFKKDTKRIGYEWIGTDTAEDCKEALEAVRKAAEDGLVCPRLKSVLAFGEAPRAFENTLKGVEEEPGAVVVRIS